jgi:gamma-glutamyl hercynylcysteine S-oxide synthase
MSSTTRPKVHDELSQARALTDRLFDQVLPEAMYDRPIPERHRLLFYRGHLEAFDWNHLGRIIFDLPPISEELDRLFAFGIDPKQGELPQDLARDWPSVDQTNIYVQSVRRNLDRDIAAIPESVFHLVLEHRLMHAETLTYLLHNLDYSRRVTKPTVVDVVATSLPRGVGSSDCLRALMFPISSRRRPRKSGGGRYA